MQEEESMRRGAVVAVVWMMLTCAANAQTAANLKTDRQTSDLLFLREHSVFPHIALGGPWTTEVTLVNLGNQPAEFNIWFWTTDGQPWSVMTAGGRILDSPSRVVLGSRETVTVQHVGGSEIETGWAEIEHPENTTIAGHAIFRDNGGLGRPIPFEAVVPLSSDIEGSETFSPGELTVLVPFDNTRGFNTCLAMANPSSNGVTIEVQGADELRDVQQTITISLPGANQRSFCLRDTLPQLVGLRGLLTISRPAGHALFSLLAFRFDPQGSFTTFFPMSPL